MLRLLLLAILLTGLGVGLRRGWVEVHWQRLQSDLVLPFLERIDGRDPFRSYSKPRQER